jgi:CubicO group peptidase (beta-lactamase class C family)
VTRYARPRPSPVAALAALAALTALASACGHRDSTSLPDPQALFSWTTEEKLAGFSHSADLYATEPFQAGGDAKAFESAPLPAFTYQYAGASNTIDDYFVNAKAAALLVIKDDAIVYQRYAEGLDATTLWQSMSVGKSVVSTLVGVALQEGEIQSLQDPVEDYIPELRGTAYEGVRLQNMLRMASGVAWNEDYLDATSDFNAIYACVATGTPDCVLPIMESLPRATDPSTGLPAVQGAVWNYSTGEAYLMGLVLQNATGMSIGQYLEKKIWKPYGMERDGKWILDSEGGQSFGGIGFNATLRDYGRLGQLVMNEGVLPDGRQILPYGWVREATTWTAASAAVDYADNGQYGYFWWFNPAYDDGINSPSPLLTSTAAPAQDTTASVVAPMTGTTADWTFAALGIFGQMIAVNQRERLVVVQWGVWDRPDPIDLTVDPRDPYNEEAVMINALTDALH